MSGGYQPKPHPGGVHTPFKEGYGAPPASSGSGQPLFEATLEKVRAFAKNYPVAFTELVEELGFPTRQPRQKTLRDEIAISVLIAMIERGRVGKSPDFAYTAYKTADAMLAERAKQ